MQVCCVARVHLRRMRVLLTAATLLPVLCSLTAEAQTAGESMPPTVSIAEHTESHFVGSLADGAAAFESAGEGVGPYEVTISLSGGRALRASLDFAAGIYSVRYQTDTGGDVPVDASALVAFRTLGMALRDWPNVATDPHRVLISILAWVDEAQPGYSLDVLSIGPGIRSLCSNVGGQVRWKYDDFDGVHAGLSRLGPCMKGDCLGRCGRGCSKQPGPSDPRVQQFTQDCFNHDLCYKNPVGDIAACQDEFNRTFDDFLDAPDCNGLGGRWELWAVRGTLGGKPWTGTGVKHPLDATVTRVGSDEHFQWELREPPGYLVTKPVWEGWRDVRGSIYAGSVRLTAPSFSDLGTFKGTAFCGDMSLQARFTRQHIDGRVEQGGGRYRAQRLFKVQ